MSRILFIVIVIAALVGSSILAVSLRNNEVSQPVSFSHQKHVGIGMECVSCHTGAEESVHAGIPQTKSCALCHRPERQFPPTPPELAKYIKSNSVISNVDNVGNFEEIPWVQLHRIKRHVYFSHRRHVKLGKVECATCHGDVKLMKAPFTKAEFEARQKGMNRCIDCHRKEKVTTDCLSCHR